MPGGALNVTNNIHALGGRPISCGIIGNDTYGAKLIRILKKKGVDTKSIIEDASRPTTLKTRVIAHQQQIARIDEESDQALSSRIRKSMLQRIRAAITQVDCVIIEDYGKGVVDPALIQEVIRLAKERNLVISVDPKEEHVEYYKGVTVITPNIHETETMVAHKIRSTQDLLRAGKSLLKKLKTQAVLITRGEQGMSLFEKSGKVTHIQTAAREVYDVSGAGDAVISAFTLSLTAGATKRQAAEIANFAGGIVVGKMGAVAVTKEELVKVIKGH